MNTTTAATTAHVTAATIRSWCRNGVIAATKTAGRWIINAASLAHRIALATLKNRKATMDLTAARITTRQRAGMTITSIAQIAPLLADRTNAITDEGNRLHTLVVLGTARIYLRSIGDENTATGKDAASSWREFGQVATDYIGTPDLPVSAVLDLAEQIRTAL